MSFCATRLFLVLVASALLSRDAVAEGQVISKYTSTAPEKSTKLERDADDPSGYRAKFRGFGRYDLEHVGGDERSWINILYTGKRADLYETTMAAGAETGAFPHKANNVVEWRGMYGNGSFTPHAVIYRLVGLDENGKRRKTRLIVIRLEGTKSRIVGHADEPNAEEKARRLADGLTLIARLALHRFLR